MLECVLFVNMSMLWGRRGGIKKSHLPSMDLLRLFAFDFTQAPAFVLVKNILLLK